MLLSTNTTALTAIFSEEEAVRLIKEAGFDAYDISLHGSMRNPASGLFGEGCIAYAEKLRAYADGLNLPCNQAHAPFHSSTGDPETDERLFREIVMSMEAAAVLGAKIIVVHPKQHLRYSENAEELYKLNLEFYARLIPYCEKFGIKVAVENMWQRNSASNAICDSTCSQAWEFNKYIDGINSKWVTGCLDIGHTSLVTDDIPGFIRKMGGERIRALHVHDTDFLNDSHTLPFLKSIDFKAVAAALGEIGYKGDFTFEADCLFSRFPKELYPSVLKMLCDTGRYLISEIDKNRG